MSVGTDHVAAFLSAAAYAGEVLRHPAVGAVWTQPSALARADVGTVAGHLFLVVRRVDKHLDEVEGAGADPLPVGRYTALRVERSEDLEHEVHRQVRADGAHVAAWGWEAVANAYAQRVAKLEQRLAEHVPDAVPLGTHVLPFDEYLGSRVTEALVHADDLAVSAGLEPPAPSPEAMEVALAFVLDLARRQHGDLAVLRSFTRRERVPPQLPGVY